MSNPRENLIGILQNAHAGELAAAYAYRGHWKSLKESAEKTQIKKIEQEEWAHRANVRKWLEHLGAQPNALREKIFWTIGRSLGASCYVSGWFFPMYFAGRLESQNVQEYVEAAGFAEELEMRDCAEEMLEMARIEGEHETFFSQAVTGHRLLPLAKTIFKWS
ncbi:MAG TPA: demethoxyubiquinone hydroxylase family protein [Pyrinomonadaceae bacterium]|jgi:demethoxyubiquinone hydroxylase (CLK1/Coq7/Cat5 family)|nr:demethoxyubiquinone hydroxylase family protein [Pyrinomonadaceae bacterium]